MDVRSIGEAIKNGNTALGIEFGSTRIKAVLIDAQNQPIASGSHDWENHLKNNIWTYPLEEVWSGLQDCYANLKKEVKEKFGVTITTFGAMGFSAMMHGYLAFDEKDEQLAEFRTWRNTITEQASEELSKVFQFHIPQRWSIAHLYQGRACKGCKIFHNTCRLYPLAADGRKGNRNWRCGRNVPN